MSATPSAPTSAETLDRYFRAVEEVGHDAGNLGFYARYLFEDVELRGARMLDVGAGDGRFSFYAAAAGAAAVVSLEPDAAGSSQGRTGMAFKRLADLVDEPAVRLERATLQDYEHHGAPFDVVLLHASINHLDEQACLVADRDEQARATYVRIFEKLADLTAPGGTLIAVDCDRRNLFGDLHVKNPISRAIEWDKHQSPEFWAGLLAEVGFEHPRIRWNTLNSLRSPGRALLGNRVAAYLTISSFCLTMRRA